MADRSTNPTNGATPIRPAPPTASDAAGASGPVPTFVVVGYVNRGKSSVISTLATTDRVEIDARPGTTRRDETIPLYVNGQVLVNFVDTPGFERPRAVWQWLKSRETDPASRRRLVEQFVAEHRGTDEFPQECELLQPILDGGVILYVVDSSKRPVDSATAEMEILQWTGQPRMALINPIRGAEYEDQWRQRLDQFFHMIRRFDAHAADYPRRLQLLRSLREVDERAAAALDRAIHALQENRRNQRRAAARIIAETLSEMLRLTREKKLSEEEDVKPHQEALKREFLAALREREQAARERILDLYEHHELTVEQAVADEGVLTEDLFSRSSWTRLGLSRAQLIGGSAATGAATGGAIDAALGGATFLAGTIIGGVAGGVGAWYAGQQLARTKVLGQPLGGVKITIGPVRDANFPWVVLDRLVLFHRRVANHAHANRRPLRLTDADGQGANLSASLDSATRKQIHRALNSLRSPLPTSAGDARDNLAGLIEPLLETEDAAAEDAAAGAGSQNR